MLSVLEYVIKDVCDISEKDYNLSFSYMTDSRKAKIERLKNLQAKKCTLAGEWLVRLLLKKITGQAAESFVINADKNGKPYSTNAHGLHFNISHSQNMVAAVVCSKNVGVDIEAIRPVNLKLAKRMCTPHELKYIFGDLPADADYEKNTNPVYVSRFLEIWTLKEAYLKYKGTGITGFEAFKVPDDGFKKIKIEHKDYVMHIVTE